jgi:hypothetical protein
VVNGGYAVGVKPERRDVPAMAAAADQMDSHAETAELMGDADGARRWRERALEMRLRAMETLDE